MDSDSGLISAEPHELVQLPYSLSSLNERIIPRLIFDIYTDEEDFVKYKVEIIIRCPRWLANRDFRYICTYIASPLNVRPLKNFVQTSENFSITNSLDVSLRYLNDN